MQTEFAQYNETELHGIPLAGQLRIIAVTVWRAWMQS